MDQKWNPQHLDLSAFARDAISLQGQAALHAWPRLADEQFGETISAGPVLWHLTGCLGKRPGQSDHIGLILKASGQLPMQCQRCLSPVLVLVEAEREFRFVHDETTAAALDEQAEEDVLVLSSDFDALALVEDELILSLPLVPLHEACPKVLPSSVADPEFEAASQRTNPFGLLSSLKKDGSS